MSRQFIKKRPDSGVKVFESLMHHQVSQYIDKDLWPFLCGYRKGFNTQTAIFSNLEKWKSTLDKKCLQEQFQWAS